jgi:Dyp-type peroxidase family
MTQSLVTVAIPFAASRLAAVNDLLATLGNPAARAVRSVLDGTSMIHFMSITAPPADSEATAHLLIEISADGEPRAVLDSVSAAMAAELVALLDTAAVALGGARLAAFLWSRRIEVGQGWFATPGLDFSGTPDMTVARIRQEAELSRRAAALLDHVPRSPSALATLERVRAALWDDEAQKWAFIPEPAPCLRPAPASGRALWPVLRSAVASFLWPLVALALLPLLGYAIALFVQPSSTVAGAGLALALWAMLLVVALELGAGALAYARLRQAERTDVSEDQTPPKPLVDAIMRQESYDFQNHLAAVSRLKPGALRRFTLRLGLWAAAMDGAHFSRPSFLGPTGVIHFARWLVLPGTDKLVFFSNYDGAWESYLENFIQDAHQGVTGIWSNTKGFPRTTNLFFDGATDGDRLRRWTRRQQYPTLFWYAAYPHLTLARIRLNAAIRQGIALARTEGEAADWLACFGSAPRAADAVEAEEIPTLVHGGLRHLPHGKCLLLRLPQHQAQAKQWLGAIAEGLSYGDCRGADRALLVAYAPSGLRRLGLSEDALATFPVAFQDGMTAPWRARALGDAPETWAWGGPGDEIDAVMVLYAIDPTALATLEQEQRAAAGRFGVAVRAALTFKPLPARNEPIREAFGFVDGTSQPVLRGLGRWMEPKYRAHLVEPGEIVLGYADSSGYLPASPTVAAGEDPEDVLPACGRDPTRQRPDFSHPQPAGAHDLGCNGSFLVVRQIEQNRPAFDEFLATQALAGWGRIPQGLSSSWQEWIAAKMVGRWRADGSSLVRHPLRPASQASRYNGALAEADNEFLFGTEDPTGERCPVGAHIRRANPRDTAAAASDSESQALAIVNRHRMLRVGRSYVPQQDGENGGLVFMCLNADIERQFEFVQQGWVLGRAFQGLDDEVDPVMGKGKASGRLTIPTPGCPVRLQGLQDFVTVKGGGYFFLPGRAAVRFLARPG